jgi:UDP-N-acetylglucosamine 2-epimerase (non-hydrolysing)
MMNILHVVGARPNFMKAAPVIRAMAVRGTKQFLVHTGQHYDSSMSEVFFQQLELPMPDVNLVVGSGTQAAQTAEIMVRFEVVAANRKPDLVVVYGDVNSTLAAGLVCSKLRIRVAHVEAGLRSFERSMPEEINRVLTDQIADLLFTPSADADNNLQREGIGRGKIHRVGNVMIDTLVRLLPRTEKIKRMTPPYALVTLHRPSNVDDGRWLEQMMNRLKEISRDLPVLFPVHPRTRRNLAEIDSGMTTGLQLLDPLPYLEFLALQRNACVVVTDSGGIQEETTFLGVPCLTVRENTERPITVSSGTNILVGRQPERLKEEIKKILCGVVKKPKVIPLWDGRAAERVADVIVGRHAVAASA